VSFEDGDGRRLLAVPGPPDGRRTVGLVGQVGIGAPVEQELQAAEAPVLGRQVDGRGASAVIAAAEIVAQVRIRSVIEQPHCRVDRVAVGRPQQRGAPVGAGVDVGAAGHEQLHRLDPRRARRPGQGLVDDGLIIGRRGAGRKPVRRARPGQPGIGALGQGPSPVEPAVEAVEVTQSGGGP
jgi:hypothetical protein